MSSSSSQPQYTASAFCIAIDSATMNGMATGDSITLTLSQHNQDGNVYFQALNRQMMTDANNTGLALYRGQYNDPSADMAVANINVTSQQIKIYFAKPSIKSQDDLYIDVYLWADIKILTVDGNSPGSFNLTLDGDYGKVAYWAWTHGVAGTPIPSSANMVNIGWKETT